MGELEAELNRLRFYNTKWKVSDSGIEALKSGLYGPWKDSDDKGALYEIMYWGPLSVKGLAKKLGIRQSDAVSIVSGLLNWHFIEDVGV